ncbi:hypothetical protein ACM39_15720 [Chryseobacterium sp. FH2]|uniref:hypothetical protein n=1 Tax=Chryseobacterium sp. FH2 TaxID=1674291 RepID=UPI00065AF22A|nr:hypothetical protein [Chryseobacterium sp. FH2]KMQ67215.1 hypothetical protein ACM39_15720 [Chryseobacterium sp. FH2]
MRNKFILWLLLITFSITFHSCRTHLEVTEHETEPGDHIHQKISTGTFQQEIFLSGVNEFKGQLILYQVKAAQALII